MSGKYLEEIIAETNETLSKGNGQEHGPENPRVYHPWHHYKNSAQRRFKVQDQTGRSRSIPFSLVMLTDYIRPNKFFILCRPFVITFKGESLETHLEGLEDLFLDEKLRYLHAYNERFFDPPGDNEPVITEIEFRWFKDDPMEGLVTEVEGE